MTRFHVSFDGLSDVLHKLKEKGDQKTVRDIDNITEAYARKMAAESAEMAPVDTGALKNSIASSPQPADEPHTWQWGSNLPYATRQEYEHRTKKAFVRRAIWNNENEYVDAIKRRIME